MKNTLLIVMVLSVCLSCGSRTETTQKKPNIIIIYADDLGYGDLSTYGGKGVKTPAIDKLAANGVKFTDAHCSAATCTPSRYALLTGSYGFRSQAEVLPGDAPLLIDPNIGTLPSMLQGAGYRTGVVGKWHLGLGIGAIDWNEEIRPGPLEVGFDYSYIIPATGDRVPCVFVEGRQVVGLERDDPITVSYADRIGGDPVGYENPELLKQQADRQHSETIINGISRIGYMSGGNSARWRDEDFADILTEKAETFIEQNKRDPFFLFFSFHDIHVPRVVHERFEGASGMGPRGDAIVQMDWCVSQIQKVLDESGLSDNTLIIFTSDNGPVLDDGYADQAIELIGLHEPNGPFRGGKYSAYESGTRVPTIVYWPGQVQPGISNALLTQVDLYASLASLVGQDLSPEDAPDSFNYLNAWLGKQEEGRYEILEEAYTFALRQGKWKYIHPAKEGYSTWVEDVKHIESGLTLEEQLYDLKSDLSEQTNLASQFPEQVEKMKERIRAIQEAPTRPGWGEDNPTQSKTTFN